MFRFSLFGIPVEVQPFFWVLCAFLGGALHANSSEDFLALALFMLAAFVSILIHELGHALTGRRLGGGSAHIQLNSFGGLAFNRGGRFNRQQRFWMIAAGPGAGFLFLLSILLGLALIFGGQDVTAYAARVIVGADLPFQTDDLISFLREKPFIHLFISHLLWINFWWGILNLLPVMPLDGGQITDLFVRPQRRVYQIGFIAAATMAAVGFFWLNATYTGVLFGYLAWKNYQDMREVRWQ